MTDPAGGSCPSCGGVNPPDAKFCAHCGSGLVALCPACGHRNAPSASFCTECGGPLAGTDPASRFASPATYTPEPLAQKIRASSRALEGERKPIPEMFTEGGRLTKTD